MWNGACAVDKFNCMGEIVEVAEFAWDKAGDLNGDKAACDGANMWNGACAVDIGDCGVDENAEFVTKRAQE